MIYAIDKFRETVYACHTDMQDEVENLMLLLGIKQYFLSEENKFPGFNEVQAKIKYLKTKKTYSYRLW